jgi:magnesium and cobalt transporter
MTPRPDVIGFEMNTLPEDIFKAINEHGYSRYPVFEKSVDNVKGILFIKDFLVKAIDLKSFSLTDVIRPPYYVPDSMPLAKLLREFQKGRNHMAVVLDEFGGTAGIITIEDILEELVGEIQDEYDIDEETPLVKHSDTVAFADGAVWPGEINEIFRSNLPEDKADTLAGLFIDTIGRFPKKNESIQIADIKMTVLVQDRNRIVRMKLEKVPPQNNNGR